MNQCSALRITCEPGFAGAVRSYCAAGNRRGSLAERFREITATSQKALSEYIPGCERHRDSDSVFAVMQPACVRPGETVEGLECR